MHTFIVPSAKIILIVLVAAVWSARGAAADDRPTNDQIDQSIDRAIDFLTSRGQSADGRIGSGNGTAVTSLAVAAVLSHRPDATNQPSIRRAIEFLKNNVRGDGGIYANGSKYRNYETSVAVSALVRADNASKGNTEFDSVLDRAEVFLKGLQWDEGEGVESSDAAYGGAGYGSHGRPDMSNTSFMLDALTDLGNGPDDEAIQKALRFVSRSQNLDSPANDTPHADKIDDGGFYYTPAAGGETKAGTTDGGGLRSYGSMTYAGLKSMIYAGLTAEDPRVAAALSFIRRNYDLDQNPGMGAAGLYYYYHTFAKSLAAAGIDTIDDADGNPHNWRNELAEKLISQQQPDGSWVNDQNDRWMEGNRELVTAYALLALSYVR